MKLTINIPDETKTKIEQLKKLGYNFDDWFDDYMNKQLLDAADRILKRYTKNKIHDQLLNLFDKKDSLEHDYIIANIDADKKEIENYLRKMLRNGEIYTMRKGVYKLLD